MLASLDLLGGDSQKVVSAHTALPVCHFSGHVLATTPDTGSGASWGHYQNVGPLWLPVSTQSVKLLHGLPSVLEQRAKMVGGGEEERGGGGALRQRSLSNGVVIPSHLQSQR